MDQIIIFLIYFIQKKQRKRLLLLLSILQTEVKLLIFSSHRTWYLYLNCLLILQKDSFFFHFRSISQVFLLNVPRVNLRDGEIQGQPGILTSTHGMNLKVAAVVKIIRCYLITPSLFPNYHICVLQTRDQYFADVSRNVKNGIII